MLPMVRRSCDGGGGGDDPSQDSVLFFDLDPHLCEALFWFHEGRGDRGPEGALRQYLTQCGSGLSSMVILRIV